MPGVAAPAEAALNALAMPAGVWLAVGVGAVLGAWLRLALSALLNGMHPQVPMGTLLANVAGGLLIGLAAGWLDRAPTLDPLWRMAISTGFLGALTTFSTFSLESLVLLQKGQPGWATLHTLLHLGGSLGAAAIGLRLSHA